MKPTPSFITANFVAREIGYDLTQGWSQGDSATQAWFRPLATFASRFDAMLGEITALGFEAIDLWSAHLHHAWATPEHIEVARAALKARRVRVVSYAGWFGANEAEFRASARLCAALEIPLLGGGTALLAADRAALVRTLREFGLAFGYENHPEKSVEEILARIGPGDEDVIGVAADTGWFGSQGVDAADALTRLAPRLLHVHLKDVLPRRPAPIGRALADLGHETCRLGAGIVPIEGCLEALRAVGYAGGLGIEHEPEEGDPREDCRAGREMVLAWADRTVRSARAAARPFRVAVVGCGNIAGAYGSNLAAHPSVEIVAAMDAERPRAEEFAGRFGGRVHGTLDEVLADPEVDGVVNLTIHHAHYEVITRCLEAGKHVHTEKPMAMTQPEAAALCALARRRGVRLSSAPVTWLGEAQATAARLLREGRLGTPRVAFAEVNWGRIETWHPNPAPFYDVGPVFDVAVYPLTLLGAWFGPVRRVLAGGRTLLPERRTKDGRPFRVGNEEFTVAVLEYTGGLVARLTCNFYVGEPTRDRGALEVIGDEGSLHLQSWAGFDSALEVASFGQPYRRVRLDRVPFPGTEFGRGVVELAAAVREGRPHRNSAELAAHVIEVCTAVHRSMREGHAVAIGSTFEPPAPA